MKEVSIYDRKVTLVVVFAVLVIVFLLRGGQYLTGEDAQTCFASSLLIALLFTIGIGICGFLVLAVIKNIKGRKNDSSSLHKAMKDKEER
ncbi:hypothetical protein K8R66_00800 [bacterium]|nr:hypothetical protein [bacterium]